MAGTLVIDALKSSTTGPAVFQNTSGTEIGQLCKAWVNFTGSTAAVRASFNVSSVTRNATGDYTVNFTNALSDANYAPQMSLSTNSSLANYGTTATQRNGDVPTSAAFRFICTSESGGIMQLLYDPLYVYFAAFR